MAENRVEQLREILSKAAARDDELKKALEALAADLGKEFGGDAPPPVWAPIKAADGERQIDEHFVMQRDKWLRGELTFEVTPDRKFVVPLLMRSATHDRHEVGLQRELSKTVVIDPPDEKDREAARKKLFDAIFGNLEMQVRESVELPEG